MEIKGGIMGELLEDEVRLQLNPYVKQLSKLSKSLLYLSESFAREKKNDGQNIGQAIEDMATYIKENYDKPPEGCEEFFYKTVGQWKEIVLQVMQDIEEYGAELSVKKKRELTKQCHNFDEVNRYIQCELGKLKQKQILNERLHESKQASLYALNAFAKAIEENAKELDCSIFDEERIHKKITVALKRVGVRTLKVTILVATNGKYEVQLSAKARPGICITTKQLGVIITGILGREFVPEMKEPWVLKEEYSTLYYVEKPKFHMLHGVANVAKIGSDVSGDNFLVTELSSGYKGALLSDGMGSGLGAYEVSKFILEMSEVLLEAGINPQLTIEMINALMVSKEEDIKFGTFDLCFMDMYGGGLEIVKAGASTTFVIEGDTVSEYSATSLPLGVVSELEVNHFSQQLHTDSFIVMMTDGVAEHITAENKGEYLLNVIQDTKSRNPKELSQVILDKVLESQGGKAIDDMMVLVVGAWKIQYR